MMPGIITVKADDCHGFERVSSMNMINPGIIIIVTTCTPGGPSQLA